uniref:Uncharacterized protein n=1 Tax=Conchiformibius kuhniae TaxID=211502 RepID=A0A8T9MX17_9NEIS|nr:hypothetical protein LVJ77_04880 [Conchiformibius kuhniae]
MQHFGNAAHARTADADKMDVVYSVFHGFATFSRSGSLFAPKSRYFKGLTPLAPCFFITILPMPVFMRFSRGRAWR